MKKIFLLILLLSCCVPVQAGAKKGISSGKVYQLLKDGNGDALKAYLKPFFDKAKAASPSDLTGNIGGVRSLMKPYDKTETLITMIASKRVNGKMYFIEFFAPAVSGEPWFKHHKDYDVNPAEVQRQSMTPARKDLRLAIYLSNADYHYELYIRKIGKYLLTRQVMHEGKRPPTEDYGFYDRFYTPPPPKLTPQ